MAAPAYSTWGGARAGRGVAFRFEGPPVEAEEAPAIDEAGYASLISLRKEPIYEPIAAAPAAAPPTNTYDSVPPLAPLNPLHLYANTQEVEEEEKAAVSGLPSSHTAPGLTSSTPATTLTSTGSYPDLLEMVTRSKTPSPPAGPPMYARVDLSRKTSRPASDASLGSSGEAREAGGPGGRRSLGEVGGSKDTLDSYTRYIHSIPTLMLRT